MTDKTAPPKKVKVTLTRSHTHGGTLRKKGDVIEVRESQAERLIKKNIAKGA